LFNNPITRNWWSLGERKNENETVKKPIRKAQLNQETDKRGPGCGVRSINKDGGGLHGKKGRRVGMALSDHRGPLVRERRKKTRLAKIEEDREANVINIKKRQPLGPPE